MPIDRIQIGDLSVSRLIIGGNPYSGFSHQSREKDQEMRHYYTTARIKEVMRQAEELGVNTQIARADHHIMRVLLEYRDEGGAIQWIAQTCSELATICQGVGSAIAGGANACFIHGGRMDYLLARDELDEVPAAIAMIKNADIPAGIAGHDPKVFEWAEEHLDVDFYMCSHYNPFHRDERGEHIPGMAEKFDPEERDTMVELIGRLSKPVIHYKVMAGGRTDPKDTFAFIAKHLRPQDAVCVGIYPKDHPGMLEEDLRLLEESLRGATS